jgi:hypothetical protein
MGTITLGILAKTGDEISQGKRIITNCYTEQSITVNAATNGTTYHVYIKGSGVGVTTADVNTTVTADTTYVLRIDGNNFNTSVTGSIIVVVRQTNSSGAVLYQLSLSRDHSGNYC